MLHMGEGKNEEQIPYSIACAPGTVTGREPREIELHIAANSDKACEVVSFLQQAIIARVTIPSGDGYFEGDVRVARAVVPVVGGGAGG
ncbi:MAG: hypothetical protein VW274_04345, partial [Thalassolituus sp.]